MCVIVLVGGFSGINVENPDRAPPGQGRGIVKDILKKAKEFVLIALFLLCPSLPLLINPFTFLSPYQSRPSSWIRSFLFLSLILFNRSVLGIRQHPRLRLCSLDLRPRPFQASSSRRRRDGRR
jgi:hypothetical protein